MKTTESPAASGQTRDEQQEPARGGESSLVVCVHSRGGDQGSADGETVFGVLLGRETVAAPIGQGTDYDPAAVEVVIAELSLFGVSQIERIPASRVDVVAPEGPVAGQAVAFVTLAQPTDRQPDLPEASQQQLDAAIRQASGLWPAVAQLGVGTTELVVSAGQVLQLSDGLAAVPRVPSVSTVFLEAPEPPPVDKHRASSLDDLLRGVCDWIPGCE